MRPPPDKVPVALVIISRSSFPEWWHLLRHLLNSSSEFHFPLEVVLVEQGEIFPGFSSREAGQFRQSVLKEIRRSPGVVRFWWVRLNPSTTYLGAFYTVLDNVRSSIIALANPDILLTPESWKQLVDQFLKLQRRGSRVGLLAPVFVSPSGEILPESARGFFSIIRWIVGTAWFPIRSVSIQFVPVPGGAFLISTREIWKELLEEIPLEIFGTDDLLLAHACVRRQYCVAVLPSVSVVHVKRTTLRRFPFWSALQFGVGVAWTETRRWLRWVLWLLLPLVAFLRWIQLVYPIPQVNSLPNRTSGTRFLARMLRNQGETRE